MMFVLLELKFKTVEPINSADYLHLIAN